VLSRILARADRYPCTWQSSGLRTRFSLASRCTLSASAKGAVRAREQIIPQHWQPSPNPLWTPPDCSIERKELDLCQPCRRPAHVELRLHQQQVHSPGDARSYRNKSHESNVAQLLPGPVDRVGTCDRLLVERTRQVGPGSNTGSEQTAKGDSESNLDRWSEPCD
jgi:hypothetical protein